MAAVWMHVDKFGGVVLIDEGHPLAVAQRAKDAEPKGGDPVSAPVEVAKASPPKRRR